MGAADGEEVDQEAFEKLLRAWDKVSPYEDPEAWLRTVTVRIPAGTVKSRLARARHALAPPLTTDEEAADHA